MDGGAAIFLVIVIIIFVIVVIARNAAVKELSNSNKDHERNRTYMAEEVFAKDESPWFVEKFCLAATHTKYKINGYYYQNLKWLYESIETLTHEQAEIVKRLMFVSIRGCSAWALMCLEQALQHLDVNNPAWQILLPKLWEITLLDNKTNDIARENLVCWVSAARAALATNEEIGKLRGFEDLDDVCKSDIYHPSEQDLEIYKTHFEKIQPSIANIVISLLKIGSYTILEPETPDLNNVERWTASIIKEMSNLGLEIPAVEPFIQYEYHLTGADYYGLGPAFDGTQYSIYVK